MITKSEQVLTKGLKAGYAGGEAVHSIFRGSFAGKESSTLFPENNAEYNDQWFFKRTGGGQDMARAGDEMTTRVFAGGIVKPEILNKLGVSEEQIVAFHKSQVSQCAGKTRLHENVHSDPVGDWQYTYEVMKEYPDLPLSLGVETITFKNNPVFIHVFLISPIE